MMMMMIIICLQDLLIREPCVWSATAAAALSYLFLDLETGYWLIALRSSVFDDDDLIICFDHLIFCLICRSYLFWGKGLLADWPLLICLPQGLADL